MAVPYREWYLLQHVSFLRGSADNSEDRVHWLVPRYEWGYAGQWGVAGPMYYEYKTVARPIGDFEPDVVNLDLLVDIELDILLTQRTLTGATSHIHLDFGAQGYPVSPAAWDKDLANGQYYDGANFWCPLINVPFYPTGAAWSTHLEQVNVPCAAVNHRNYGCSYKAGLGPEVWMSKYYYERQGICVQTRSYSPADPVPAGESCTFNVQLKRLRYLYLNAVCNSLSRYSMPPAGGVPLILTGLGFNNVDAEVSDVAKNPNNSVPPAGGWNDDVYHIEFRGLQGQGTYLFHHAHAAPQFTVDSNTQITIPAMPVMADGSYEIYMIKDRLNIGGGFGGFGPGYSYAGDWRAAADGRLTRGTRITFFVGDPGGKKRKPVIFSKWRFKKYGGEIFKYYAPIDTVTPTAFYDGRILSASAVSRGVNDKGGLYGASDLDVEMANHDLEFSKLLAEYFLKNQLVELFYGWADEPFAFSSSACKLIVDDYSRAGSLFRARLRDITTKYFRRKVPLYRCTVAEYPNIHPNSINKAMPEILGNAALTTTGQGGAVEAVLIDTVNRKYLAARGSLKAITAVYIDGGLCPAGPPYYTVNYDDGGRTYITVNPILCGEEAKITFDAQGYQYAEWDSAAGYVQNSARILEFFLGFLTEVPEEFIDFESFDLLADAYDASGVGTAGFLILQKEQDAEALVAEQLFTWGALSAFDKYGRFHVERKDLSVLATDLFIFSQIDTLEHPNFNYNLAAAQNRLRYRWNYAPGQEIFQGGAELTRPSSISDFEEEIEAAEYTDFPWTTSATWAAARAEEELLKYGYGCPLISFSLPLAWMDDVDIMTDFRLQDPYGSSRTGGGERGRYCYVSRFSPDFLGGKLDIEAFDLSWLLRQYLILGDETALPAAWINATDEERVFAYLCDEVTGRLPDGEPGKKLADENMT